MFSLPGTPFPRHNIFVSSLCLRLTKIHMFFIISDERGICSMIQNNQANVDFRLSSESWGSMVAIKYLFDMADAELRLRHLRRRSIPVKLCVDNRYLFLSSSMLAKMSKYQEWWRSNCPTFPFIITIQRQIDPYLRTRTRIVLSSSISSTLLEFTSTECVAVNQLLWCMICMRIS